MEELDRILDRDDVLVTLTVDLVDHRSQRRRFSGAGRAGHQDQSARSVANLFDDRRQSELFERQDLVRDLPVDGRCRSALIEDVGAESSQTLDAERNVELEIFL